MSDQNDGAGIIPALGDAGPCPEIRSGNKTWTVGHPTQAAKAELERIVVQVAIQNLDELRAVLPRARWAERAAALDAKIEGGHWKTHGSLWTAVNSGPLSQPLFLLSLLRKNHPDATVADAQALWLGEPRQAKHALAMVVPGFFAILAESAPMPPEDRPAFVAQSVAEFLASLNPTSDAPSGSSTSA